MTKVFLFLKRAVSKPDAQTVAKRQLNEARRQLLVYQSQTEYCASMVKYYETSIKRLAAHVEEK